MTEQRQREVLSQLKEEFVKNSYETFIDDEEDISLKALINLLGKEELGAAIMELSFSDDEGLKL